MKMNHMILMLSLAILGGACTAQGISQKKEEEKLMEVSREWARVAQTGNAEKIMSYWSKDAILMTPDQGTLTGHEQIGKMLGSAAQIPGFAVNWEPKSARISKSGELGYVIAHKYFKLPDASGKMGTYYFIEVGIWEKQADGTWKNTVDIYNPAPGLTSL